MAELLINEFFSTYPFHMFAYLPFHTNLRYPGKITILLSALADQLIKSRHAMNSFLKICWDDSLYFPRNFSIFSNNIIF